MTEKIIDDLISDNSLMLSIVVAEIASQGNNLLPLYSLQSVLIRNVEALRGIKHNGVGQGLPKKE